MSLFNERYCRQCQRLVSCLRHVDGTLACAECSSMRVEEPPPERPIAAVVKLTSDYLCKACGGSGFRECQDSLGNPQRVLCACVTITCVPDIGDCT